MDAKTVESTFAQLREYYKRIQTPEAKNYGLVLGGHNEVYLMKGDGKKSVFLGRLYDSSTTTEQEELKKFLIALRDFFEAISTTSTTTTKTSVSEAKPTVSSKTDVEAKSVNTRQIETPVYMTTVDEMDKVKIPEEVVTMEVTDDVLEDEADFSMWADQIQ